MRSIADIKRRLVEIGGIVLFVFSLSKIVAPESVPIGMNLNFYQCIIGIVIGLIMMGHNKKSRDILKAIKRR